MAGGETQIRFTTDIDQLVTKIASGVGRIKGEVGGLATALDGADLGSSIVRNMQADMAKVSQLVRETSARITQETLRAGQAASKGNPFQAPAGGTMNAQLANVANTGVRALSDVLKVYTEKNPELRQVLAASVRDFALGIARDVRETGTAATAQFSEIAAAQRKLGISLPVQSALGRPSTTVERNINQAFPQQDIYTQRAVNATLKEIANEATRDLRSKTSAANSSTQRAQLETERVATSRAALLNERAFLAESEARNRTLRDQLTPAMKIYPPPAPRTDMGPPTDHASAERARIERERVTTQLQRFPINLSTEQRRGEAASPFYSENDPRFGGNDLAARSDRAERSSRLGRFGLPDTTRSDAQIVADRQRQATYASQSAEATLNEYRAVQAAAAAEAQAAEDARAAHAAQLVARGEITEALRALARKITSESLQGFVGMQEVSGSLQAAARQITSEALRSFGAAQTEAEQARSLAANLGGRVPTGPTPTSLPPVGSPAERAAAAAEAENARALARNLGSPGASGSAPTVRAPELVDADRKLAAAEAEQAAAIAANLHGVAARGPAPTSLPPEFNAAALAQREAEQARLLAQNLGSRVPTTAPPSSLPPRFYTPPPPPLTEEQGLALANQRLMALEMDRIAAEERRLASMSVEERNAHQNAIVDQAIAEAKRRMLAYIITQNEASDAPFHGVHVSGGTYANPSVAEYHRRQDEALARGDIERLPLTQHGPEYNVPNDEFDGSTRKIAQRYSNFRARVVGLDEQQGDIVVANENRQRDLNLQQLRDINNRQGRISDDLEREARAVNRSFTLREEQNLLLELEARERAGTASRFGTRNFRTDEGGFYTQTQGGRGQRAVEPGTGEYGTLESRYEESIQRKTMQEEGQYRRASELNAKLNLAIEEEANAHRLAAELVSGQARKFGSLIDSPSGIYRSNGPNSARQITEPLEVTQAKQQLARDYLSDARQAKKTEPVGFWRGVGNGLTSRNGFSNSATGEPFSRTQALTNVGTRFGSVAESFAGFAALGAVFKAVTDTRNETVAYITALTNLEVRMRAAGAVSAGFTNQLEGLSRLAGSNVSDQLDAASRAVAAFGDTALDSKAKLQAIAQSGAEAASELSVISGTTLTAASNNLIAVSSSFGLAADQLDQVGNAVANAKQLGGESAEITNGLAGVAEAASQAGYNTQQAADMISLITARTNESGEAAATRLTQIFQLIGSHQSVLTSLQVGNLSVDTTAPVKKQIEDLAAIFPKLSEAQQKATLSQLGGRAALRELIPLLTEQPRLQAAYAESLQHSGAGTDEFNKKNANLAGLFRKLGGDITNIQLNLERSGIFNGIGVALKALEPGLRTLSDLLGLVDRFIDRLGPFKAFPGILIDFYVALKLIDSVRGLNGVLNVFNRLPGLGNTPPLPRKVTKYAEFLVKPGTGADAAEAGTEAGAAGAKTADTAATTKNTAETNANAAAKTKDAAATQEAAAASVKSAEAHEVDERAVMGEITALSELNDLEMASAQLQARSAEAREMAARAILDEITAISELAEFEALLARTEVEGLGPITELINAEKVRADLLRETTVLEERRVAQLELTAKAEQDAALASAERTAALKAEGEASLGGGGGGIFGLFRRGRGKAGAAAGEGAGAGLGAVEGRSAMFGPVGMAIAAGLIIGDPIFHAVRDAGKRAQKALDETSAAVAQVGEAFNPADMHKSADALRLAASDADKSTAGFFGSTRGFLSKYVGDGTDSNADAQKLRDAAKREDTRADTLNKAETAAAKNGSGAVFAGAATTIDGIKAGFDKMSAAGLSAEKQINALVEALGGFGDYQGAGTLMPGQAPELAQTLASRAQATQETLLRNILNNKPGANAEMSKQLAQAAVEGGKVGPMKLKGLDATKQQQMQDDINKTVTDYISKAGLNNGGHLSDDQQKELANQIALVEVKALGVTGKDYDAALSDAQKKVLRQLRSNTDPGSLIISQQTADFVAQQLVQRADAAGQHAKLTTGSDVAGARKKLAEVEKAEALVLKKGQKVNDDTKDAELAAKQALADALSAQADSYEALTKDELGKDDAVGRARQDVATAARHLAEAEKSKDPNKIYKAQQEKIGADRAAQLVQQQGYQSYLAGQENINDRTQTDQKQLEIERNKLAHTDQYGSDGKLTSAYRDQMKVVTSARDKVLADQVDDLNSMGADSVDSRDAVGNAQKALDAAKATLASLQARHAGARELKDAQKAVADASVSLTQAQITDQNTTRDAAVGVGDTVGEAYSAYLDLVNSERGAIDSALSDLKRQAGAAYVKFRKAQADAQHTARLAKINPADAIAVNAEDLRYDDVLLAIKGQDSGDIAAERARKIEDLVTRAQLRVALANAKSGAAVRQGDPLSSASDALFQARNNLTLDKVKNEQYYQDLASLHQVEYAYAQAVQQHTKVLFLLSGDTTDPVEQARADLKAATAKLAADQRNKTGDLAQDHLDKETAQQALQKAQFDQQMSNQQNAYALHEESADQYLNFLKSQDSSIRKQLHGMRKGQEGYQQLVDELNTIDTAIQGLNASMDGQFNLGSIKLPTIYEVRRAEAQGATAAGSSVANSVVNNTITIQGADMQTVINYLSSVLGKSSMTVATTGRKATA